MDKELEECFRDVRNSANAAMAYYQIWFTLRGEGKAIDTYLDVMNDTSYFDFFHAANIGNYKLMFIEAGCLFDSDPRSKSIKTFKQLLTKNNLTTLENLLDERLSPYKELVSNIKTIRSKLIAHKDSEVEEKSLYKKHGIKPDDIKELLNTTADTLSEIEHELFGFSSSTSSTDRWEEATFNLLKALKASHIY